MPVNQRVDFNVTLVTGNCAYRCVPGPLLTDRRRSAIVAFFLSNMTAAEVSHEVLDSISTPDKVETNKTGGTIVPPSKPFIFLFASMFAFCTAIAPAMAKEKAAFNPLDPQTVAIEAYAYLYPLVLMDLTRLQMTNFEQWDGKTSNAPMNTLGHFRAFPPLEFKTVVRANFDTLYSLSWVDMTNEPMILSIPDSEGRYYLMPTLDMWTDTFAAPGWRTTGTKAGDFAYCPPGWQGELPEGVTRVDAATPFIWLLGRTKTEGQKDYAAVHKIQDGMKLTPLSQWGKKWKAPAGKVDPSVDMKTPPAVQVEKMSGKQFFEYASKLMKLHPPKVTDFSQVARLKHLGIVPGEDLDYGKLDSAITVALDKAPADALVHRVC